MPETDSQTVRFRQRRRTRAAIVNATAELLRSGRTTPGVSEIAEAADVSRRTAYQYFPTVDQILLDATLGLLSQTPVDNAIAQADPGGDASGRVSAMIRALTDLSSQTMPLGRSLIRLTVDAPAGSAGQPKRGRLGCRPLIVGLTEGERPSLRCVISARLEQRTRCRRSARVSLGTWPRRCLSRTGHSALKGSNERALAASLTLRSLVPG